MSTPLIKEHGVAVLGAGPVGLAAAAHLLSRGIVPTIFEAGAEAGHSFRSAEHVRLFSPWRYNIDHAARELLERQGWQIPALDALPTAGELRRRYLVPLAGALAGYLRFDSRVLSLSRLGLDKIKTAGRDRAPFVIRVLQQGEMREHLAGAVIDATGTWGQPNPLGADGLPVAGEAGQRDRIVYGIPDVLGRDRARYAGKSVLVVGSGHSAVNALLDLAELSRETGTTRIHWAVRGDNLRRVLGGGSADRLPARGELGLRLGALLEDGRLSLHTGFRIRALEAGAAGLTVRADTPAGLAELAGIDEIVCATGARPDLALSRELRVRLDAWLESVDALAPLIDPNEHSCGTVRPHGHRELAHPEPGFYIVGAKSYGRAPTFLMATGYEQVRSIAAALAGDMAAADEVRLELPETGVCSASPALGSSGACCGAPAPLRIEEPAAACCGGEAPAGVDACCALDAQARQAGRSGCGCGPAARPSPVIDAARA
ncbi:NAD(P)-binding protein [Chitinimonas koreensis]|uniref:NAD(P)-binding protein n=1 Tax=Chitinimonas koreensis TaxID=356302 RepID=UPI000400BD2F|nr:NAD(P)-binding protein [Chitinimonas koreensis]QNM96896.1 NAD(P)-binding domain-containing protein [Chitinimonas koreensis]